MGITTSKDTRRISFDNTFALNNSALAVAKSIEDESIVSLNITSTPEAAGELVFADSTKFLEKNEEESEVDYWAQRIEKLKKEHQIINKIIETEYDKKIESTNKIFEAPKITHEKIQKMKPCFDWRSKIKQCYDENPHQPLVCAAVVQAFSNCVASCRAEE